MRHDNIDFFEIFPWDRNFETGIHEIDAQHKRLVDILNHLAAHLANRSHPSTLNRYFSELADYANYHFTTEESVWREYFADDIWLVGHEKTHSSFIGDVIALRGEEGRKSLDEVILDVVSFLSKWLALHILQDDMRMAIAVRAMEDGCSRDEAKIKAAEAMDGSMKILIETVLNMYEKLTSRSMGIMREKTMRKRAEVALIKAKEEADSANMSKSMFLANMSHEIRTPMNAILGMTDLALKTELTEKQQNYIKKAHQSAENLLRIINDILDFSKIEAGKLDVDETDFILSDVVGNMAAVVMPKADEKSVGISVEIDKDVPNLLRGDPLRLGQILTNLVGNAVKFSDAGDVVTVRIAVKTHHDGNVLLTASIRDDGVGISEEQQRNLFKEFSQADSSTARKYGGSGLGLVICKKLVELMGGRIWVDSEEGVGSTFSFTANFKTSHGDLHQENPYADGRTEDIVKITEKLRGVKLLLVEDDELNQELAQELLAMQGIEVVVASNGKEALEKLEQQPFDGVLMDCEMPVMNGYEATREIRAHAKFETLPILAMTANAMMGDRDKAIASGMNDQITKPIDPYAMFATIARWVV